MTDELPRREQAIHADRWAHTREGVRIEPIAISPGARTRVVLTRPAPVRSVAASHGGFTPGTSFPRPALLSLLVYPHRGNLDDLFVQPRPRAGVYQVFAHVGRSSGELGDKRLADRRARLVGAMLEGDVDTVLGIAQEEAWGAELQQVTLRALMCDPGPIDGIVGPLTRAAVERFQARYVLREFHERAGSPPRSPHLAATGDLDTDTAAALVEALVSFHAVGLASTLWHPSHPRNGCGAYNPVATAGDDCSDRVSLVVHDVLPPHHDTIPCTAGDPSACAIVGDHPQRCSWFRTHVVDAPLPEVRHHHFRLSWLPLPSGKFLLSALTTVPDREDVEIQVFSARHPVDGEGLPAPDAITGPLGESLHTRPLHGVAQVVWDPPSGFRPRPDGRLASDDGTRLVPVFRVLHAGTGTVAFDTWPADEIAVLLDRSLIDGRYRAHEATALELSCAAQGLRVVRPTSDAVPYDGQHYVLRFEGVEPRGLFTLVVRYGNAVTRTIVQDVPYDALDDHGAPSSRPPGPPAAGMDAGPAPDGDAVEDDEHDEHASFPLVGFSASRRDTWLL